MGSCAAPSAKGDDKFITTDYLQQCHLNITGNDDYFSPVFTMAKFQQEGDRVLLPVSVQVHHAVCDGFHAARFINTLQLMCDNILK